jgi:CPA2 family monovalent cation:H+ antiporter-2
MPHETALIVTIAAGFGLAFLFGLLAVRLRLPPLVGYLVAGICIGPFTPGFVADQGLASQLAEIGVILLMFGVGLHFSIRDLLAVRKIAIPGATVQIAVATALGGIVAHFWGWSWSAGLVFGLALSVASTVVLLRALEARGLLDSADGRIAVGWLVIEDLVTVLALVLLPAIAAPMGGVSPEAAGHAATASLPIAIGLTFLKVGIFLALMLFVGTRLVPWLLERVARTGSRELFTLAVLAVALGIAVGAAALFDVSFALGAFFAGVVISESDLSHQAAADALPLQDAFAVLFFVSVGMLFDPTVLVRQPLHVLATVLIILIGKSVAAFGIVLLFRYPVRTALLISASLAQIGEFSFILAGLGVSLGLIPEASRSLVLAGAIISITMNPVLFGLVDPIDRWLRARPRLLDALERSGGAPNVVATAPPVSLHDHAIIIGYGRVGGTIGETLSRNGVPYAVIERDRVMVESLRKRGVQSVFGDAARAGLLEQVHVDTARILIVTAPEPYHARRIVELARQINPDIVTVVRTHSDAERLYLERLGVGRAVMGERELAFGIAHFALVSLGRTDDEADVIIDGVRRSQSARSAESGTAA